jgi:hypothetical protein
MPNELLIPLPHHLVKEVKLEREIARLRAALEQIAADPNKSGADHAEKPRLHCLGYKNFYPQLLSLQKAL